MRHPRLLYSEVSTCLSSRVQKLVQRIFGILLKFSVRQAQHEFRKSHCRDAKNTIHSFVFNCLVRQYIDGYIIKGNSFYSRLLQYKVSLCLPFWFSLVLVLSLSSVVLPTKLQYHLHPRNYHHLPTITMRKGVCTNKPQWAFAK